MGVQGNGPDVGISGFSPGGIGVRGINQTIVGGHETGIGVLGDGASAGVEGQSDAGVGVEAQSRRNTALIATTQGTDVSALIVNHRGTGNIIIGRNFDNAEVFRVTHSGDVQVRGVTLTSDENAKNNFSNVNTRQILEKLVCMQIQEWNYKTDPTSVHHIGPTSQDFQAAFGLSGDDDLHISLVDAQGIAMAAIQGLNEKLNAENAQLRASLASLEARLAAIESKHRTAVARVSGAK